LAPEMPESLSRNLYYSLVSNKTLSHEISSNWFADDIIKKTTKPTPIMMSRTKNHKTKTFFFLF